MNDIHVDEWEMERRKKDNYSRSFQVFGERNAEYLKDY